MNSAAVIFSAIGSWGREGNGDRKSSVSWFRIHVLRRLSERASATIREIMRFAYELFQSREAAPSEYDKQRMDGVIHHSICPYNNKLQTALLFGIVIFVMIC